MGQTESIQFFGLNIRQLKNIPLKNQVKRALDIFTRQPQPQPGYKPFSLREMQKKFLSQNLDKKQQFYIQFLQMIQQSTNLEKTQVSFAKDDSTIFETIKQWYENASFDILVLAVSESETGSQKYYSLEEQKEYFHETLHATAIFLQKNEAQLHLTYFNSNKTVNPDFLGKRVVCYINEHITNNLRFVFRSEETCPRFQMYFQGGNCTLWQLSILCLFMFNPQYIQNPKKIYDFVETQNPDYFILLFEMFVWYNFCTRFPNYFQLLYDQSKKTLTELSFDDDMYIRYLLITKDFEIPWCPVYTKKSCNLPSCIFDNNKCDYADNPSSNILELKDRLQDVIKPILNDQSPTVRFNAETQVAVYSDEVFTPVAHYVCSLVVDTITFFYAVNRSVFASRVLNSTIQVNVQCKEVFNSFLNFFLLPTFEECLDYIFTDSNIDPYLLQFHCPTAAKIRYLLSEGKNGDELPVPTEPVVLYTNMLHYNITFSSTLVLLNSPVALPPVAVTHQPVNVYNYVLFSKPQNRDMNYLDKAMWNGFLQQMTLVPSINTKNLVQMNITPGAIPYFPSLPVITQPPVLTPS